MTPSREPRSLAEIVREQTNDGLLILEFLIKASRGELQDFDTTHRLEAARRLLDMFVGHAILRQSRPDSSLAIVLSNDLDLFREVVRFETDAVEGRCEDVAVRQRIVLAEQLRRCMTLASGDAAPSGAVGARFSRVLLLARPQERDPRRLQDRPLPGGRRRMQAARRNPGRRPQRPKAPRKLT